MLERGGGAFEVRAPAAAKQKRSTLAQGSATAARRPAVAGTGGYGSFSTSFNISANGTPRTQYSDALTPRGPPCPFFFLSSSLNISANGTPRTQYSDALAPRVFFARYLSLLFVLSRLPLPFSP